MKRILIAVALLLIGSAAVVGARTVGDGAMAWRLPLLVGGCIAICTAVVMLLTALSPRSKTAAMFRLDHFLPFLRKKKQKETLGPESLPVRLARRVLPAFLFSDRLTGKPGLLRRMLKRIGPSAHSAPLRRVVQGVCFLLFLWLFFYVLWPYSAEPAGPGNVAGGWRMVHVDGESGDFTFASDAPSAWHPAQGRTVHVIDSRALDAIRGDIGEFRVVQTADQKVTLAALEPLADEHFDALLTGTGTWALHERSPWPRHYTDELASKEFVPAELFLVIDPLVSLSTAVASRSWVWSLASAGVILIVCVLIPRGFCGYLCPLGTLIDLFDWAIGRRVTRLRVPDDGWWVHIKYYLLAGTMVAALFGILLTGYVAAIPVITRGLLFLGDPLHSGTLRGWSQLPPMNAGHIVSIVLFLGVLGLGFLKPRFWCKYVCPSGAVFSLGNLFRISERKVEHTCINCNKCVEICPFDAIKPDFTTRTSDCTLCQTCAGVCPTHAIKFVERWNLVQLKDFDDPPTHETQLGRRGFVSLAAGTAAALAGGIGAAAVTSVFGARLHASDTKLPVRPPGSVPEQDFLQMCIRCGECFKACPYNVLQPLGFEQGLEGLWTPAVVADHAGCAPSCNACGQVCPTGAIRALALEEKKVARMGLAIVNPATCLPLAGESACQLCVDECTAAGYHALEFQQVHTEVDTEGRPIEGTGFLAPVVLNDKCVGCGLCQMSCYRVNVKQEHLLSESAIIVEAGEGKEDRLMQGSYRQLRHQERQQRRQTAEDHTPSEYFVPDAAKGEPNPFGFPDEPNLEPSGAGDDPFGMN